ncbi:MAG: SAM-dependent methyltransferase [Cellvibrionaceae bacterium]|jgi:SAM-dependent methyltransferase
MPYSFLTKAPERFKEIINARFGVKPLIESQSDISSWFSTSAGQRLLQSEQIKLNRIMPEMYGYHLMQLSVDSGSLSLSRQSPVTHHFSLGVEPKDEVGAVTEFESLPIDAESIDVALLHHVLEYSTKPHQLLRETARTIIPNGYIIVVGFNPWSFSTTKRQLGRLISPNAQRRFHNLRRSRLLDWLQLLDFEPVLLEYGDHGWPVQNQYGKKIQEYIRNLFPIFGSFYIIVARKSITPMTIIKPEWKKVSRLPSWAKGSITQHSTKDSLECIKK